MGFLDTLLGEDIQLSTKKSAKSKAQAIQATKSQIQGRLIVLDGIDGSGKSTQTDLLMRALDFAGFDAVKLKFPRYGQRSAALLEAYLAGEYKNVSPEAAAILYAIDRFDDSARITDLLEAGKIIVCDRYTMANAAHQGSKITDKNNRIAFYKWLDDLEYRILNIPKPHLNIIIHTPIEIAAKLKAAQNTAENRKPDIHEANLAYLRTTAETFIELAHLIPNTKLIHSLEHNKLLPPQAVHNKIWEVVRRLGLKNITPNT